MNNGVDLVQGQSGTPQRWKVLSATFLSYFYDSYDLIILSIAMPVIITVLDITLAEGGLLSSVSMIGAMTGSVVLGVVAENRGRRFALILSLVWFGIATLPVIFIQHFGSWMVLRFLAGFGIGGVWGPSVALLTKHWNAEYRARANSFMLSTFALGGIAAAILGRFSLSVDWRILFLVGATAVFVAIYAYFAIPPDENKEPKAEKVIKEKIGVGALFTKDVAKTTILATLLNVANMGGYWGVNSWVPTYLKTDRGLSLETMANFAIVIYIGMFIGYQAWSALADKIGRKKVIMLCFLFDMVSVVMYLILPSGMILFFWGAVVGFGFGGVFGVMGAYYAELFPDRIRALAGGFCFNIGRLGSVLAPFTVGLIGQYYGLKVGLAITPAVFGLGLICIAFLPETMKKKQAVQDQG